MEVTSLLPIDVGFDLKIHNMLVHIQSLPVKYLDKNGVERISHIEAISAGIELANAGYSVVIGETPEGRDIQVTPKEKAPIGSKPGYDWTGPTWAMLSGKSESPKQRSRPSGKL